MQGVDNESDKKPQTNNDNNNENKHPKISESNRINNNRKIYKTNMTHIMKIDELNESMSQYEVPEQKIKKCLRGLGAFIEQQWFDKVKGFAKNNNSYELSRNNIEKTTNSGVCEYYTDLKPNMFILDICHKQARFTIRVSNWKDMSKEELIDKLKDDAERNGVFLRNYPF